MKAFPKNKWLQFLILWLVLAAIWALMEAILIGESSSLANLIGAALAFSVIGFIVLLPFSCISVYRTGYWPKWQVWGAFPVALIAVVFASYDVAANDDLIIPTGGESYSYQPDGCELSALFPGTPNLSTNHIAGGYESIYAYMDSSSGALLKAECMYFDDPELRDQMINLEWPSAVREFIRAEGFSNESVLESTKHINSNSFRIIDGRGYAEKSGKRLIYDVRVIVGEDSSLMLHAVGVASEYPNRETTAFMDSYKIEVKN